MRIKNLFIDSRAVRSLKIDGSPVAFVTDILILDYRNATSRLNITNDVIGSASDIRIILPETPPTTYFMNDMFASNLTGLNTVRISGLTNLNGYSTKTRSMNDTYLANNTQQLNLIFEGLTDFGFSADFTGSRIGQSYWFAGAFKCGASGQPVEYHFPDVTRIDFTDSNFYVQEALLPKSFYNYNRKYDVYFHKDLTYADLGAILAYNSDHKLPAGLTLCTFHFTAGSRSVIENSPNYSTKWGTDNLIVVFDL